MSQTTKRAAVASSEPTQGSDEATEPAGSAPEPAESESIADASAADAPVRPFMSEGVRQDLEMRGYASDPASGGMFRRDPDTGEVTFTDRAGNITQL